MKINHSVWRKKFYQWLDQFHQEIKLQNKEQKEIK